MKGNYVAFISMKRNYNVEFCCRRINLQRFGTEVSKKYYKYIFLILLFTFLIVYWIFKIKFSFFSNNILRYTNISKDNLNIFFSSILFGKLLIYLIIIKKI